VGKGKGVSRVGRESEPTLGSAGSRDSTARSGNTSAGGASGAGSSSSGPSGRGSEPSGTSGGSGGGGRNNSSPDSSGANSSSSRGGPSTAAKSSTGGGVHGGGRSVSGSSRKGAGVGGGRSSGHSDGDGARSSDNSSGGGKGAGERAPKPSPRNAAKKRSNSPVSPTIEEEEVLQLSSDEEVVIATAAERQPKRAHVTPESGPAKDPSPARSVAMEEERAEEAGEGGGFTPNPVEAGEGAGDAVAPAKAPPSPRAAPPSAPARGYQPHRMKSALQDLLESPKDEWEQRAREKLELKATLFAAEERPAVRAWFNGQLQHKQREFLKNSDAFDAAIRKAVKEWRDAEAEELERLRVARRQDGEEVSEADSPPGSPARARPLSGEQPQL
jgi:hypothetical protein